MGIAGRRPRPLQLWTLLEIRPLQSLEPFVLFCFVFYKNWASLIAQLVKNLPAMQETWVRSLGWEYPLEKGKATHSNTEPAVQSMGLQRVGHDWATFTLTSNRHLVQAWWATLLHKAHRYHGRECELPPYQVWKPHCSACDRKKAVTVFCRLGLPYRIDQQWDLSARSGAWGEGMCMCLSPSVLSDCDPLDCSPPESCVHGILHARILKWIAVPISRGSSPPRDQTRVS